MSVFVTFVSLLYPFLVFSKQENLKCSSSYLQASHSYRDVVFMHLSMLSRRGGRQGIGRGFDFFAKNVVKFPTPGLKFCVKSTKKSPPRAPQQ